MGIAREVFEHIFRLINGVSDIHHPVASKTAIHQCLEPASSSQRSGFARENQLIIVIGFFQIIVALINNEEATVKRFFLRNNHIELRPENEAYPVMHYEFGEVLIQGKVIGVQRGPDEVKSTCEIQVKPAQ